MANWLKNLFSRQTAIDNQTIHGNVQQADTINNLRNIIIHIPKIIALLLVILTVAILLWRGNFFIHLIQGNQNVSGNTVGGNLTINQGISEDKLIELAEKLGVVKSERDEWIHKYQDLEKSIASRTDETAKQAKAFLDKGDLEQAGKLFDQALENDLKNAAENAYSAGRVKELQWDIPAAINRYQKAVQLNPDNAIAWNDLGSLLKTTGELDQAIAAYQTVLKLGQTHQNNYEIAPAYGNLGLIYKTRGDLDKAVEMHTKALAINQALGRKEGMATNYGNLGIVYDTRGDLNKAIEMYNKALELNQALGNKEGIAINYGNLGLMYDTRGELHKAVEMYNKALELNQALGSKEGMAINYANLGLISEKKGNTAKAKRYWLKAIELYKYIGSPKAQKYQKLLDDLK